MREIIGNTTATPSPRPDWKQTDSTKGDYIKNKPVILTEAQIRAIIREMLSEAGISSDFTVVVEDKVLHILSEQAVAVSDDTLCISSDLAIIVKDEVLYL